jgi:transposase-like protein
MDKQERSVYRETKVTEYRASGLSAAAFCRQAGIKASTFHYWVKKLDIDQRDAEIAEKLPEWISIPVKLKPSNVSVHIGQVTIDIGSGCDEALLVLVLKTVMTTC